MKKRTAIIIIIILAVVAVSLTGIVGAAITRNKLTNSLINRYGDQELVIAHQAADQLESEVKSLLVLLKTMAVMTDIRSANAEVCNRKLTEVQPTVKDQVGNIGRMNAKGVFYCSINPKLIGVKGESLGPYLKDIVQDPSHKAVISRVINPPGAGSYALDIHVPVYDEKGAFQGTVGGALYLNKITENYLTKLNLIENGYVVIQDDNGDVLFHPQKDLIGKNFFSDEIQKSTNKNESLNSGIRAAQENRSTVARYDYKGDQKIAAFVPANIAEGRRLTVLVTLPIKDVKKVVAGTDITRLLRNWLVVNILILIAPLLLLIWVLHHYIFKPLQLLTKSVNKVRDGDFESKFSIKGNDEIGQLGSAFNDMGDSLIQSYSALESRVTERTKELDELSKSLENKVNRSNRALEDTKRVNDLMIGREIKMRELKQVINDLESKLSSK